MSLDELMQAIAFLFRRKNGILSDRDFVLSASMDLNWFTPREAQRILDMAFERGLILKDGSNLKPNFDSSTIDIPLNFVPNKGILSMASSEDMKDRKKDLFAIIVDRIAERAKMQKREVIAKVNKQQERMNLEIEVAGLLVGRELGVDFSDLTSKVEEEIAERGRGK